MKLVSAALGIVVALDFLVSQQTEGRRIADLCDNKEPLPVGSDGRSFGRRTSHDLGREREIPGVLA